MEHLDKFPAHPELLCGQVTGLRIRQHTKHFCEVRLHIVHIVADGVCRETLLPRPMLLPVGVEGAELVVTGVSVALIEKASRAIKDLMVDVVSGCGIRRID